MPVILELIFWPRIPINLLSFSEENSWYQCYCSLGNQYITLKYLSSLAFVLAKLKNKPFEKKRHRHGLNSVDIYEIGND